MIAYATNIWRLILLTGVIGRDPGGGGGGYKETEIFLVKHQTETLNMSINYIMFLRLHVSFSIFYFSFCFQGQGQIKHVSPYHLITAWRNIFFCLKGRFFKRISNELQCLFFL